MSARIIYLDQNKWIDLARSAAGPGDDFTPAVEFVRAARAAGAAVFPLSAAHYIESNKQHDDERFERLGRFMHEISGTVAMAGPVAIVRHEIEMAFLRALPHRIEVQPFSLLGKGVGHAIGMPGVGPRIHAPVGLLTGERRRTLQTQAQAMFEESVLTGRVLPPWSTGMAIVPNKTDLRTALATPPDDHGKTPDCRLPVNTSRQSQSVGPRK
jgi:hypothetical protein